jgi:hypothetical protein
MPALHIDLNDREILIAGGDAYCSLCWDLNCSRFDSEFGRLTVNGMVERPDGKYDHNYWLEDLPLARGDRVHIRGLPGAGENPIVRLQTYEQLEELRLETIHAEAAGEFDAARAAPKLPLKPSCGIELVTSDGALHKALAVDSVTMILCGGVWSAHHRPTEWNLHLRGLRAPQTASGFWLPVDGSVTATLVE